MTTLRSAAKQALELLERLHGGCTDSDDGTVEAITVWCPEIITALRASLAQQTEPDLSRCPQCNGPADNGFDRSFPPSPYLCTKCMAEPCPNCASLEAQNTELDRKLAEMEQVIEKLRKEILKE